LIESVVILAHPNLEESRVNKVWKREIESENVVVHDLYANYPNFIIDIKKEQELLKQFDRIIFEYPLYWYNVPPLLKKWQDEVLVYGFEFGENSFFLKNKELVLAISAGGIEKEYQSGARHGFTLSEITRPLQMLANLCQMNFKTPFVYYGTHTQQQMMKFYQVPKN